MSPHQAIADLPLHVDDYELQPLQQNTGGGWTRLTTVVALRGGGLVGHGEDVTYADQDQLVFRDKGRSLRLAGQYTFAEFSRRLAELDLFPEPPR